MNLGMYLKKHGIKKAGLLAESEGVSLRTVYNWYRDHPELIDAAIARYLEAKK